MYVLNVFKIEMAEYFHGWNNWMLSGKLKWSLVMAHFESCSYGGNVISHMRYYSMSTWGDQIVLTACILTGFCLLENIILNHCQGGFVKTKLP